MQRLLPHTHPFGASLSAPRGFRVGRKAAVIVALLVASFASGCARKDNVAGTNVGREELYRIDNVKYDEFFEDVNNLQKDSKGASDEEKKARAPLQDALGVTGTSSEALADLARDRVKKLAGGRPKLHVGLEGLDEQGAPLLGHPIAVTPVVAKRKLWPKDAKEFAGALEETARGEGQIMDKYGPLVEKARKRLGMTDGLRDSIDSDLASASDDTRKQTRLELAAAHAVLGQIEQECQAANTSATKFLERAGKGIAEVNDAKPDPKKGGSKKTW